MSRTVVVLILSCAGLLADGGPVEVERVRLLSVAEDGCSSDPLVFWSPGGPARGLVRVRLAATSAARSRVSLTLRWGLLPPGAPLTEEAIAWSDAEPLGAFDVSIEAGGRGEVFASIPIARRAREWREAGLVPVRCRVVVSLAEGTEDSAAIEMLPR